MKTGKLWMAAGLACLFAATAGAEWQRTVSAWDTRLPAQGKLQLSLWADRFAADEGGWDYAESSFMLGVNYGLLNRWSVGVAPGIAHWSIEDGDSETSIADIERIESAPNNVDPLPPARSENDRANATLTASAVFRETSNVVSSTPDTAGVTRGSMR